VMIVLGVILGFRPEAGVVGVVLAVGLLLLFCFSLSWLWTLFGLLMRKPEAVMYASMMVLFPATFLSNVLVDPATMPGALQVAVRLNPISHVVTAVRGLMHGTATSSEVVIVLAISAALVVVFGPLTMRRFHNLP
jgi:ABC-2 type transport system permease protein